MCLDEATWRAMGEQGGGGLAPAFGACSGAPVSQVLASGIARMRVWLCGGEEGGMGRCVCGCEGARECVGACVRARVRACVRARVRASVWWLPCRVGASIRAIGPSPGWRYG